MSQPPPDPSSSPEFVVWDEPPAPPEPPRDDLDGRRIQQVALLRRSLFRTRSYCLIGMWACFGAAAQCLWLIIRHIRHHAWSWQPAICLLCMACFLFLGMHLLRKSRRLLDAARRSSLDKAPASPPDFSSLGDGSQAWKNLEQMQDP